MARFSATVARTISSSTSISIATSHTTSASTTAAAGTLTGHVSTTTTEKTLHEATATIGCTGEAGFPRTNEAPRLFHHFVKIHLLEGARRLHLGFHLIR